VQRSIAITLSYPEMAKRQCGGFEISNVEGSLNACYRFACVPVQYSIDQAYYDIKRDIRGEEAVLNQEAGEEACFYPLF